MFGIDIELETVANNKLAHFISFMPVCLSEISLLVFRDRLRFYRGIRGIDDGCEHPIASIPSALASIGGPDGADAQRLVTFALSIPTIKRNQLVTRRCSLAKRPPSGRNRRE